MQNKENNKENNKETLWEYFKKFNPLLAIFFLFIQNIFLFNQQYFNEVGFYDDFFKGYHAIPFFWMTNLRAGIFPEWVTYQAMGYPLEMNLQSGLFYPPFYIFPLLGINYTIKMAVLFQCLHVFLASVGMFYLSRTLKLNNYAAFLAGAAYQLFGGFYAGSPHSDMVRAWAIVPWLFMAFYIPLENPKKCLKRNVILVPLLFAFLFTGGYPSIATTSCFMLTVFLIVQLLGQKALVKEKFFIFVAQLFLMGLGIGLAMIHLLPAFLMRSELQRYNVLNKIGDLDYYFPLSLSDLMGLFLPSSFNLLVTLHHLPAMFIGLPMVFFLFMALRKQILESYLFIIMAILSVVMGMGVYSPIFNLLKTIFPPLGYSRFPIADYKGFLAISLIIISANVINKWLESPELFSKNSFIIRGAWFLFIFFWGCSLYKVYTIYQAQILLKANFFFLSPWLFFVVLLFIFYGWIRYKEKLPLILPTMLIFLLMSFHGYYINRMDSKIWEWPNATKSFETSIKMSFETAEKKLKNSLIQPLNKRPERLLSKGYLLPYDPSHQLLENTLKKILQKNPEFALKNNINFCWQGYITGNFILLDYMSGMNLARQHRLVSNVETLEFLTLPSETLLFEKDFLQNNSNLLPENWRDFLSKPNEVSIKSYQANTLEYEVNLTNKQLMVENETFFKGWKGFIIEQGKETVIFPTEVAGGLRGWELSEGKYSLKLSFTMPYLRTAALISVGAIIIWLLLITFAFLFWKDEVKNPA